MLDSTWPPRKVSLQLVAGQGHYDTVIRAVLSATCSVWISTANLKDMMIRSGGSYASILSSLDRLAQQGVELRILHAKLPSQSFRQTFDQHPRLVRGGLELRLCPRVHLKTVIVDGALLYLGSANWTGAGLGVKASERRNFELGIVTDDVQLLDQVQAIYQQIWSGEQCARCLRRDICEAPLDL